MPGNVAAVEGERANLTPLALMHHLDMAVMRLEHPRSRPAVASSLA